MKNFDFKKRNILVSEGVIFFGKVAIERDVQIWNNSIIGFSKKGEPPLFENINLKRKKQTSIKKGTIVKPYSLICEGAKIGINVEIYEYSRIGFRTLVGDGTKIVYGAKIYDDVIIGKRSIISGFCCNKSKIGNETTMMGCLLHKYPV